jgi:hypothetical protein
MPAIVIGPPPGFQDVVVPQARPPIDTHAAKAAATTVAIASQSVTAENPAPDSVVKTAAGASPVAAAPQEAPRSTPAEPPPHAQVNVAAKANGHPSIADTFERLLSAEEIEASFAGLEQSAPTPDGAGATPSDLTEVRALFAQLAANHVRPVRDFVMDLRWSDATVDWLAICRPALRSLRRAAEKLELGEVCGALESVERTLDGAQDAGTPTIAGDLRRAILARYDELARVMPQAFALDLDRSQREAVILQSLLLQVPGVKKVTLDKMYAAGLTTLEAMLLATSPDLEAATGIGPDVAARIIDRFRAYRDHVKATVPDATRARERERLADLTRLLRRQNEEHQRASQSWSREAEESRRQLRKARAQTMLDVQVELARLGEVERIARLEKLPFEAKLAELEAFLDEANDRYASQA